MNGVGVAGEQVRGATGESLDARRARPWAIALVVAIVLVRAWAVRWARFTGDESYFWATARNIARLEAWPMYGPPLTGSEAYHPGPIFYYLMALPQRLGASPLFGGVFVALLHGLAALLLYAVMVECRGPRAGLTALGLLVFAPWDVLYGDRIWLSCVAPVWGTLTLFSAHRAARKSAWLGAFVFFALVCPQLHMSAPIVWAASLILLWARPPARISVRALAMGSLGAVLAYAPAIYWELTHGFENTLNILRKGGGTMGAEGVLLAPLRVVGYAILYGTSEIGYHFARGYWAPFSESAYYATREGLARYVALHGPFLSVLNGLSVILSLIAFVLGMHRAFGEAVVAVRTRSRAAISLESSFTVALGVALVGAAALLMTAKKDYFPHYTNLLMPLLFLPLAGLVDRAFDIPRLRRIIPAAAALSVVAMASSTMRYYRDVDALNGLVPTLGMVDRVVREPQPFAVDFAGFPNRFAWEMLANTLFGRPLPIDDHAAVRFRVENAHSSQEAVGAGVELFGPVLLRRSPAEGP